MLNFTVGPVMSSEEVLAIGAEQVPYFRTPEFSATMLENERIVLELMDAPKGSRVCFMTGSGTASMESVVMNVLSNNDRAIVVNGGSFGNRFCQMCQVHGVPFEAVVPTPGCSVTDADLAHFANRGFTAFVVNIHETSTGVHYDLDLIAEFCRRNNLLLVIDAISSFLADPLSMAESGAAVVITGSQKALACPPGISLIVLSPEAIERVQAHPTTCMYLDLKDALKNGERGQTPFTPAVGTLLQINRRLRDLEAAGGARVEIERIAALAADFRAKIADLPFEIASKSLSNAVTPLRPTTGKATEIFTTLKDEYGIWICPNGGALADTLFRVGHIGALTPEDNTVLVDAFKDLQKRGVI